MLAFSCLQYNGFVKCPFGSRRSGSSYLESYSQTMNTITFRYLRSHPHSVHSGAPSSRTATFYLYMAVSGGNPYTYRVCIPDLYTVSASMRCDKRLSSTLELQYYRIPLSTGQPLTMLNVLCAHIFYIQVQGSENIYFQSRWTSI